MARSASQDTLLFVPACYLDFSLPRIAIFNMENEMETTVHLAFKASFAFTICMFELWFRAQTLNPILGLRISTIMPLTRYALAH